MRAQCMPTSLADDCVPQQTLVHLSLECRFDYSTVHTFECQISTLKTAADPPINLTLIGVCSCGRISIRKHLKFGI